MFIVGAPLGAIVSRLKPLLQERISKIKCHDLLERGRNHIIALFLQRFGNRGDIAFFQAEKIIFVVLARCVAHADAQYIAALVFNKASHFFIVFLYF